ncbi:glycoside hydrolase family 43 protein [Pelagicoccus sp. SDUM812003]|uniref:glycoside hydrolase family 43 protein n=1 Tax=Pelagicoccus sp. SDUM812003 TaxID=3041267 RepID=UPI00280EC0B5|nr:glycoside hydrolase family 43 protein [Pelagicoccus sp. SDUM812003]MDQ8205680.1 glycoside hydrolase family 43 protein [Pelagicoccus sp. SDUM812003]
MCIQNLVVSRQRGRGVFTAWIFLLPIFFAGERSLVARDSESSGEEQGMDWPNPLLPQHADPHAMLHSDGYYYFTATRPEYDRIELRRAKTLAGLADAEPKVVWKKHETGEMGAHIWAPEIHYIDGRWYIYFAAGEAEAVWNIRMYVLENASANPLQGEWVEKGKIEMDWESFTLDATTFQHRETRYLVWTQNSSDFEGTGIYIAKMDTPWSIVGGQVCISRPEYEWEKRGHWVNEAPAALIRNGKVFVAFSASATDANYCLGLLTADDDADLLDPASWSKTPEPVFKSDATTLQFGPGHNSFTTSPDGRTDIMLYHARNYERIEGEPLYNPDRATRAIELGWNEDGTPFFGTPPAEDGEPN